MADLLINNKIIKNTLLFIILAEILSFLGYYYQPVNFIAFFVITIITLALSLRRLEYGLYILLAELLIGSFGYLFYFETGGLKISLRLALWLIIMSVWLAKALLNWLNTKQLNIAFLKSKYFSYFFILFIFIAWGSVNGVINNNSLSNLFFDFNNWLYFLLVFPLFELAHDESNLKIIKQIFLAAVSWLSLKTLVLAYFFSHSFNFFLLDLYRWVRLSGTGEITQVVPGFSRIFMQSQIFILIGFFILLFKFVIPGQARDPETRLQEKILDSGSMAGMTKYFLLLALLLSAIIISFSRSFWLGLAAGGLAVWLIMIFKLKIKLKQFLIFNFLNFYVLSVIVLSLGLTAAVVKFPYPRPAGKIDAANLLESRVTAVAGEAGAVSRWQLLPPLWEKIKTSPVLGQGFGATITYQSNDPRILTSNPKGEYTTYAFEWGWLDVWLKLGFFGLLAYLAIFAKLIFDCFKSGSYLALGLAAGLIVLAAVNFFSPYVNHPLGIGYIVLSAIFIKRLNKITNNKLQTIPKL